MPLLLSSFSMLSALLLDAGAAVIKTPEKISFWELLFKGGWVMVPILTLLLIAIFMFIYKLLYIKKLGSVDQRLLEAIIRHLRKGELKEAHTLCENNSTLVARIFERGINRIGSPIPEIEAGMESAARAAATQLDKYLSILASVATMAPMFGFLGTVLGMITVFTDIAASNDNLSISTIAEGMYVKMVTSSAGLVVGILAHIFNTYLNSQVEASLAKMENAASEMVDVLYRPA
jgi:biopolymer transport protein ExbB